MRAVAEDSSGINVSVVVGVVASEPQFRTNAEGETLMSFDVVCVGDHGRLTVPISFAGESEAVVEGAEVCVTGFVRRRFFRAGPSVASRTEIVAEHVVPVRRKAQVRKVVQNAVENLLTLVD